MVEPTVETRSLAARLQQGLVPQNLTLQEWNKDLPLYDHQKTGVAWLYLEPKALLADGTGVGKTATTLGLVQYLRQRGEIGPHPKSRVLIVTLAGLVKTSWEMNGLEDFTPGIKVQTTAHVKAKRRKIYADPTWEVLITSYETLRNDVDILENMNFGVVVLDEADAVKNPTTKTHKSVVRVSKNTPRRYALTATPQTSLDLMGFHGILTAIGLEKTFGSKTWFLGRYHNTKLETLHVKRGGEVKQIKVKKIIDIKNSDEFKEKLRPYYLRRTRKDISVAMPELESFPKFISMNPDQEKMYKDAERGFIRLGVNGDAFELKDAFIRMRQIALNPAIIGGPDSSGKMDWLVNSLLPGADWEDEKIVVFSTWKMGHELLRRRLDLQGIGHVSITGNESKNQKAENQKIFKFDEDCRVIMGTKAMEKGLNLQTSRIQVNLDMLFNPASHEQLAGRVQRMGSKHSIAYSLFLISVNTIEHKIHNLLKSKQGVSNHILDANSEVFEDLSPRELFKIVKS